MGADSKIEWTHHTFNPWWGCTRVSPGCERCYAETFAKRVGQKVWGVQADRRFFGDKHWAEPLKWNKAAEKAGERHRVFCASMADVFEDRRDLDEQRARLWCLIDVTPNLDWLLLTKRPENIARMLPPVMLPDERVWPWPNVWLGTTVEDQQRADERIPHLLRVPAAVRFLSCEPLLEAVDIDPFLGLPHMFREVGSPAKGGIHWVIVGGESGHGARPFDMVEARAIVKQCQGAGVAVHVKQMGADPIDGTAGCSVLFRDKKGGDWNEWPEDLRIREYPKAVR